MTLGVSCLSELHNVVRGGMIASMTMQPAVDERYELPFEVRLRHAMKYADVSIGDLADELDVHRNTVGAWLNGRNRPRRRDLRIIAMRTGFAIAWLETGKAPTVNGEGQGLPEEDSNFQPAATLPSAPRYARVVVLRPTTDRPVVMMPAAVAS